MSAAITRVPLMLALPALAGAVAPFAYASGAQARLVFATAAFVVLIAALTAFPWAALPTVVLGGEVIAQALGLTRVTPIVQVHGVLIVAAVVAVTARRWLDPSFGERVRTPVDVPMAVVAAALVLFGVFGLARGNPRHEVLVAAYELAVVPVYFFLATLTLTAPARLRAASLLFLFGAAALALAGLAAPGRHGGLLSLIALVPTLAAASSARGRGRLFLLVAATLFAIDAALSAYRAVWLAGAIALTLLLLRGTPTLRRITAATLALALSFVVAGSALGSGMRARVDVAGTQLHQSSGYRLSEARLGMQTFASAPLLGQGLGQVEPQAFVPGFGTTDVGPVYHVFYVTVLANCGLVGLLLLAWPLLATLRRRTRGLHARAFAALLAGMIVAAGFAGPTDGHWELGLLPALVLLAGRFQRSGAMR
jgi:hypothetical protein